MLAVKSGSTHIFIQKISSLANMIFKIFMVKDLNLKLNEKFNRLTIIEDAGIKKSKRYVKAKCDCGGMLTTRLFSITSGQTKSCGCFAKEVSARRKGKMFSDLANKYPESFGRCEGSYARNIINTIKNNALHRKKEWELDSLIAFEMLLQPCYYCGKKSVWPDDKNGIDRIDSSKGYVEGNVVTCCWPCNRAKGNQTLAEFKEWITQVNSRMNSW